MGALTAILTAISNVFGWLTKRSDLANQPDVKAAAKKQDAANARDKIRHDIATGNLDAQRQDWAD